LNCFVSLASLQITNNGPLIAHANFWESALAQMTLIVKHIWLSGPWRGPKSDSILLEKRMALVLLANVTQYAGPAALEGLLGDGHHVACHDTPCSDAGRRADFDKDSGKATALAGQAPKEIHNEVARRFGLPDAIVSNDVYLITRNDNRGDSNRRSTCDLRSGFHGSDSPEHLFDVFEKRLAQIQAGQLPRILRFKHSEDCALTLRSGT
jgi:hypothetical protein